MSSDASTIDDAGHDGYDYAGADATLERQPAPNATGAPIQVDASGAGEDQLRTSLAAFLTTASRTELDQAALLSDLSNMAYDLTGVSADCLLTQHRLHLVTSSLACRLPSPPPVPAAAAPAPTPAAAPSGAAAAQQLEDDAAPAFPRSFSGRRPLIVSAMDLTRVADEPLPPPPSAQQLASLAVAADAGVPGQQAWAALQSPALASAAGNPLACRPLAAPVAVSPRQESGAPALAPAGADGCASGAEFPADWFVVDSDAAAGPDPTRIIVIQGSITLEHWRINLTIDPCAFEGPSTGVQVHRGVYNAALRLLDALTPIVEEFVAASPRGKLVLTGHSLGGSLATVLMLLLVGRGTLPVERAGKVHAFGAPAVFCEGALEAAAQPSCGACAACSLACAARGSAAAACSGAGRRLSPACGGAPADAVGGLLARLRLPADAVTNVIMTRDIVPRAFVCDYTAVAGVLRNWSPSFKQLAGLSPAKSHKVLYNFIGNVEVLQPPSNVGFVLPDEGHDMLPPHAALYKLTEPACELPAPGGGGDGEPGTNPLGLSLGDAILAFMNSPHPLQTLGEVRAYGPSGSISRFHNPDNYTRALRALLH